MRLMTPAAVLLPDIGLQGLDLDKLVHETEEKKASISFLSFVCCTSLSRP